MPHAGCTFKLSPSQPLILMVEGEGEIPQLCRKSLFINLDKFAESRSTTWVVQQLRRGGGYFPVKWCKRGFAVAGRGRPAPINRERPREAPRAVDTLMTKRCFDSPRRPSSSGAIIYVSRTCFIGRFDPSRDASDGGVLTRLARITLTTIIILIHRLWLQHSPSN